MAARADEYNRAAEEYFSRCDTPSFLLNKPFSEPAALPKHLIDVGVLVNASRIAPGDTVLEFGAGSCWLSHMLNRYGCPTISVDVSATAIEMGQQMFRGDPHTNWTLGPRFLAYDGHRLPIDDESCDCIVIKDAFHHVPNQREVMHEMWRVLRADGVVAMSEPGRGHGHTHQSAREMRDWGVLENELTLENLATLARESGFKDVRVVATSPLVHWEIDARDLAGFMGGKGFASYWKTFCAALEQHHYIVALKGVDRTTTRRPRRLEAEITSSCSTVTVAAGRPIQLAIEILNKGDTIWLGGDQPTGGWTRIGAHLYRLGRVRELVDFDWWRGHLPAEVPPGHRVMLTPAVPAIDVSGHYAMEFDLVIEGVEWFAGRGSNVLALEVLVGEHDVSAGG